MAKYLLLNADTEFPQDWRMPQRVDCESLRAELRKSMVEGTVLTVPILLGSATNLFPSELLVNGAKVASAAVVEVADEFADRRGGSVHALFE